MSTIDFSSHTSGMTEVTKDAFFKRIGGCDVHPSIEFVRGENGRILGHASHWKAQGMSKRKYGTSTTVLCPNEEERYFLPKQ